MYLHKHKELIHTIYIHLLESSVQLYHCIVVCVPQESNVGSLLEYCQEIPVLVPVHAHAGTIQGHLQLDLTSSIKDVHSIVRTGGRGQME